jgi:hypothetical protein
LPVVSRWPAHHNTDQATGPAYRPAGTAATTITASVLGPDSGISMIKAAQPCQMLTCIRCYSTALAFTDRRAGQIVEALLSALAGRSRYSCTFSPQGLAAVEVMRCAVGRAARVRKGITQWTKSVARVRPPESRMLAVFGAVGAISGRQNGYTEWCCLPAQCRCRPHCSSAHRSHNYTIHTCCLLTASILVRVL